MSDIKQNNKYVWLLIMSDDYNDTLIDIKVFHKKEDSKEIIKKLEKQDISYVFWRRKVLGGKK